MRGVAYNGESAVYGFEGWVEWRPLAAHLLRICYGETGRLGYAGLYQRRPLKMFPRVNDFRIKKPYFPIFGVSRVGL